MTFVQRTDWVDSPSTATPIMAADMLRIEQGIVDAQAVTYANLPAGSTLTVLKDPTTGWPARPTARADIIVAWKGPDPSPAIVSSGTGGMLNGDYRLVTA